MVMMLKMTMASTMNEDGDADNRLRYQTLIGDDDGGNGDDDNGGDEQW